MAFEKLKVSDMDAAEYMAFRTLEQIVAGKVHGKASAEFIAENPSAVVQMVGSDSINGSWREV